MADAMDMIFCPNCGKRSGFKRALGFGTFFMVLLTFGLWLFMIPFYPARCINCGETRGSANWQNASRTGKIVIACMWVCIVLFILHAMRDNTPRSTDPDQETAAPPVLNPHESRLAELRKKQEGIGWQMAMELEMAKNLASDAEKLSIQPFPDPGERQFLLDKMDQEHQRLAELAESKKAVDAEIAKEEGQQQPAQGQPSAADLPAISGATDAATSSPQVAQDSGSPSQIPPVALNSRGTARLAKGDLDGAIQDYSEAIRLKPDYADSFNGRGVARHDKGDLDGAIQDYSEAIRLKPDYSIAFDNRGTARHVKGDLDGAIQDHSEAIRLEPDYARAFHNRGTARHDRGDLDGAIQDYSEAIRLKPDYADSFNGRGVARHDKGDLDGAIQDFTEAIRLLPDYAIAFDNRGTARRAKGDLDGAMLDLSEAIRLRPDYARAFHDRGATRARKGDAAGAQQDNSRAIQLGWH